MYSKVNETVKKVYGNYSEKILQFGEGNFLRAFIDWMVDEANENGDYKGSIVMCQAIPGNDYIRNLLKEQDGVYTLVMRGIEEGEAVEKSKVITSVSRCINAYDDYDALMELARNPQLEVVISNTTEAGITYAAGDQLTDKPASSFPAKVCAFLYERYQAFGGAKDKGLLFLPMELIDQNGTQLKKIILQYADDWGLEQAFKEWVVTANKFTNTLVDRIVTGYPKDQAEEFKEKLGYEDNLLVTSELFNLLVLEGRAEWADILPIHKGKPNVLWTEDASPYKKRKVRILNGGHTSTVPAAYLAGHNIVLDFMKDEQFQKYLNELLYDEVIPTLDLKKEELEEFANSVLDRFANPYIKHNLLDIMLNCCSKFYARCLPSILEYKEAKGEIPKKLAFSFATFIKFYEGSVVDGIYTGVRSDKTRYAIRDDAQVIDFFREVYAGSNKADIVHKVLSNEAFWGGRDLTQIEGLEAAVNGYFMSLYEKDVKDVIQTLF